MSRIELEQMVLNYRCASPCGLARCRERSWGCSNLEMVFAARGWKLPEERSMPRVHGVRQPPPEEQLPRLSMAIIRRSWWRRMIGWFS